MNQASDEVGLMPIIWHFRFRQYAVHRSPCDFAAQVDVLSGNRGGCRGSVGRIVREFMDDNGQGLGFRRSIADVYENRRPARFGYCAGNEQTADG